MPTASQLGSDFVASAKAAAKMFLPPLYLTLGFALGEVLISMVPSIFINEIPILLPYGLHISRVIIYVVADIAFVSLFITLTVRKPVGAFLRKRAADRQGHKPPRQMDDETLRQRELFSRQREQHLIKTRWLMKDQEYEEYAVNYQHDVDEGATDFEVIQIILPMLCALIVIVIIAWPLLLLGTIGIVLVPALRGTTNLMLRKFIDWSLRGAIHR